MGMDYEATDRDMSSWVVATTENGVRLYLADNGVAVGLLSLATRYRWSDQAARAAHAATAHEWDVFRVAEEMAR